jgi:hypothetical protein
LERTRRKRDRASTRLPHHRVVKRDRGAPLNKTLDVIFSSTARANARGAPPSRH